MFLVRPKRFITGRLFVAFTITHKTPTLIRAARVPAAASAATGAPTIPTTKG